MKIGLGIDTGGTYTDAVLYDFSDKKILHCAKSLTTKEDLSLGIANALAKLPSDILAKTDIISLSTTLATNACVEDKGWHAKLVFIGMNKMVIEKFGEPYGIPPAQEIYFLNGGVEMDGTQKNQPNWDKFARDMPTFLADADAVAIVEQFGSLNPTSEKKAKTYIEDEFNVTAICGHELFADLNAIKRAASTVLNARLIPIIQSFIKDIKLSLKQKDISAPLVIVRSDCSLMADDYTKERPVDTLLCGPAASVLGGIELTGEKDCIIVDMGGTTTDIAIVENGVPQKAENGVDVGKWQTFVKAVQVDTIGLGGDSRIIFDRMGKLLLGPERIMPLCMAASRWPSVTQRLEKLSKQKRMSSQPLHEFLCLLRTPSHKTNLTEREKSICEALKNGPLILEDVAGAINIDVYNLNTKSLEQQEIIIRAGLTPTDLMHVNADFDDFDIKASNLAAGYIAGINKMTIDELTSLVYDHIKKTIYTNIVTRLLKKTHANFKRDGLGNSLNALIEESWHRSGNTKGLLSFSFDTSAALVGLGGPIHIFLDDVAKALCTKCIIPKHANVANALGAVVGHITAQTEVSIRPESLAGGNEVYMVLGEMQSTHESKEAAICAAKECAEAQAKQEALRRGASGDIIVTIETQENIFDDTCLGIKVTAKAVGSFTY